MRVVELVSGRVDEPQPIAAALVVTESEDGAVGDGHQRLSERAEDVGAVVVAPVGAGRAEGVDIWRGPEDGKVIGDCSPKLRMNT